MTRGTNSFGGLSFGSVPKITQFSPKKNVYSTYHCVPSPPIVPESGLVDGRIGSVPRQKLGNVPIVRITLAIPV